MAFPNRVLPTKVGNGGFTGKTLRVDLTTRTFIAEPTLGVWSNGNTPFVAGSGTDHSHFWGGNGQAYKVLWDEVPNSVKWYDPANRIHFGWGPMSGSGAPSSGRTSITSLCPGHCAPGATVTGRDAANNPSTQTINCVPSADVKDGYTVAAVANGHMGGHFSAECKYAGWDSIVVQGKASGPVYIAIFDNDVRIVDAPQLWGCGIMRTTAEICQAMGPGCHVAACGQAGQNLVPQATVMCDNSHGAGAGMGAVMGSKNLVGIGALGTGTVNVAVGKAKWRTLIENAMRITGSCYQACGPNNPQPWAEYWSSGVRWYAKKGQFWWAANPPVETGACDPHETDAAGNPTWRQNMGYRCLKSDPGVYGEKATVRMDGCNACPVRCHQLINVPSAAKWDNANTFAMNTCSGWWSASILDASKYQVNMATNGDLAMTKLETYVCGHNMSDDFGLSNNYSAATSMIDYMVGTDGLGARIKCNVLGNTLNVLGTNTDEWNYLTKGHLGPNVPSGAPAGDSSKPGYSAGTSTAAGTNGDTGLPGFLTLRWMGDLRAIREYGRLYARMVPGSKFGIAMGAPNEWTLNNWMEPLPDGTKSTTPLRAGYVGWTGSTPYWGFGYAWHHGDYETGELINIGYNTHAQNHCWGPIIQGGSPWPDSLRISIVEDMFKQLGYGTGMGAASDYSTLMNQYKARAARWAESQKDMCDSTGLCSWVYPYWSSPTKERGYRGDMTLPCQYFNALTGSNLTPYQFELENERFFVLQTCLMHKRFGNINKRMYHDTIGPGGRGQQGSVNSNNRYTQWNIPGGVLESFYKEMRWDIATGAPTIESLTALGLDAAHGTDVAGYFATAGMPLPHLPATDPLLPYPPSADPDF